MKRLPLALSLASLLIAPTAAAQRFRPADFTRADLSACTADPVWVETSVRVSLVVHPDGGWAVALDGSVDDAAYAGLVSALRNCIEGALVVALGRVLSPAPRAARVYVRVIDLRSPPPTADDRRAELRERFEAARMDLSPGSRARIRVTVAASGAVVVVLPTPDTNRGLCISNSLGLFGAGAEASFATVVQAAAPGRVVTVGEGGLCGWGERRGPPPVDTPETHCAAGLSCCASGGAAGSDSVCMRVVDHCPAYP